MGKRIRKSDDFYREALIWMGYRYAIGISNYGSERCRELVESLKAFQGLEYDTPEFHALAAEIANNFHMPTEGERRLDPIDLLMRFMLENDIRTAEQLAKYKWIEVKEGRDGSIFYETRLDGEAKKVSQYAFSWTIDDLLGWDDLAKYFDPRMHKRCKVRYKGKEQVVEYFDSWRRKYGCEGEFPYEKLKRPVDGYEKNPQWCTYVNEAYVVEDEV